VANQATLDALPRLGAANLGPETGEEKRTLDGHKTLALRLSKQATSCFVSMDARSGGEAANKTSHAAMWSCSTNKRSGHLQSHEGNAAKKGRHVTVRLVGRSIKCALNTSRGPTALFYVCNQRDGISERTCSWPAFWSAAGDVVADVFAVACRERHW